MYNAIRIALGDPHAALDVMAGLLAPCRPGDLARNPIAVLDVMSSPDGPVYCPLVFGYVDVSATQCLRRAPPVRAASAASWAVRGLRSPGRAATDALPERSLRRLLSPAVQIGRYAECDGQSSLRAAWPTSAFYRDTIATVEKRGSGRAIPATSSSNPARRHTSARVSLDGTPPRHILQRLERSNA